MLPGACCLPQTLGAEGYTECLQPQEEAALSICHPFTNVLVVSVRELAVLIAPGTAVHATSLEFPAISELFLCLYLVEPLFLKYVYMFQCSACNSQYLCNVYGLH